MFPFYVALGSGALLLIVSVLLSAEERRGGRIVLSRVRAWLDVRTERIAAKLDHTRHYVGTGSFRAMFHYVLHGVISRLGRASERASSYFRRLERRNRKMARQVRDVQKKSHLDLIAEHKATTALSEKEREALKQRSLEGDI